ncbi:hypothetical protein A2U01_0025935, partial [Trifolium medium]|nr:hypothetical protein [Trifolium medium]
MTSRPLHRSFSSLFRLPASCSSPALTSTPPLPRCPPLYDSDVSDSRPVRHRVRLYFPSSSPPRERFPPPIVERLAPL